MQTRNPLKRSFALFIGALASTSALAAIQGLSIDGLTLRWNADTDWMQVQDASNYQSICEGVFTECTVPIAGSYHVINHTLGKRSDFVEVTGFNGNTGADVVAVAGNTISWPDDGWYQVQSVSDYSSLCEGGSRCEVPDGTYIVINHTSGHRYEDIVVPQHGSSFFSIDGNTIRFNETGWMQVQSAVDYATFCEGWGSEPCTVPDGVYHIINLTTGQRAEWVEVSAEVAGEPVLLTTWREIVDEDLALVAIDDIAERLKTLADDISTCTETNTTSIDLEGIDAIQSTESCSCPGGGDLTRQSAGGEYNDHVLLEYQRVVSLILDFDNCTSWSTSGVEHVLDGRFAIQGHEDGAARRTDENTDHVWDGFSLQTTQGEQVQINGELSLTRHSSYPGWYSSSRSVIMDSFLASQDGENILTLLEIEYQYAHTYSPGGFREARFSYSGTVASPQTGGASVQVDTENPFSVEFNLVSLDNDDMALAFTASGRSTFTTRLGDVLTVSGTGRHNYLPREETSFPGYIIRYESADGEIIEREAYTESP